MHRLPVEIYPVAAVRRIDQRAIEDERIPGYTLMTRAGTAAVAEARHAFPDSRRWLVVCGAGNNAGDGYVVARLAAAEGVDVSVVTLVDPTALKGDAKTAYDDFVTGGGAAIAWSGVLDPDADPPVDLIVDAMLGSGLERPVGGEFAKAVAAINAHPAAVLALDIPTGLHGDTGDILGSAVLADLTVTFVGLKAGLFLGQGREHIGELRFAGLDIPARCHDPATAVLRRIEASSIAARLPRRPRDAHKGDFGHVLVVGGGVGMAGAVRLCGEAALRAGAGLVSIATHPAHAAAVTASRPELMSHAIDSAGALEALLERATVIAFGPGLGRTGWSEHMYAAVEQCGLPSVWDADALNWLATYRREKGAIGRADKRIITPHPGEAGTLLGTSSNAVQKDRLGALTALHNACGGTVVLKGAGSLVSSTGGPPYICLAGNPGMAAPGMGDVLTGIIAALLAQGLLAEDAAATGVEVHALAGDRAAGRGERGLLASDVIAELRGVLNP